MQGSSTSSQENLDCSDTFSSQSEENSQSSQSNTSSSASTHSFSPPVSPIQYPTHLCDFSPKPWPTEPLSVPRPSTHPRFFKILGIPRRWGEPPFFWSDQNPPRNLNTEMVRDYAQYLVEIGDSDSMSEMGGELNFQSAVPSFSNCSPLSNLSLDPNHPTGQSVP